MSSWSQSTFVPPSHDPREWMVYVIDDDESMRLSLDALLRSNGLRVATFESAQEFLAHPKAPVPSCLILDVRLRGESGLAFQEYIARNGVHMPIVFVTGYGDIAMTVKAMKAGAVDFFSKPFRDQDMLDAVASALARDSERLAADKATAVLRAGYDALTPRERDVMRLVVTGMMNKQIAAQLSVSEVTVKIHRGQVMRKMAARSIAELVKKSQLLDLPAQTPE